MAFSNTIWFYGLATLLIPILIHLWNKKELKTINIGSVLWLPKGSSQKSRSVRLKDILLLLLRILIITCVVLGLANPLLKNFIEHNKTAVFVDPSLTINDDTEIALLIDSLEKSGAEKRWFMSGLPLITEENQEQEVQVSRLDYWSLLEDIDRLNYERSLVISDNELRRVQGVRPVLKNNINWVFANSELKKENIFTLEAITTKSGFKVIEGKSQNNKLKFKNYKVSTLSSSPEINLTDTFKIYLTADDEFKNDVRHLTAAINAIKEYTNWPLAITSNQQADLTICLKKDETCKANNIITWQPDKHSDRFIRKGEEEGQYYLTKRISVRSEKLTDLPVELIEVIRELNGDYQQAILNNDSRTIDFEQVRPKERKAEIITHINEDLLPYIWMLLLTLICIERGVAFNKGL